MEAWCRAENKDFRLIGHLCARFPSMVRYSFMPGQIANKFDRSKSNFVRNLSDGRLLFSALWCIVYHMHTAKAPFTHSPGSRLGFNQGCVELG